MPDGKVFRNTQERVVNRAVLAAPPADSHLKDLVDTAEDSGLNTLVAVLEFTELDDVLRGCAIDTANEPYATRVVLKLWEV